MKAFEATENCFISIINRDSYYLILFDRTVIAVRYFNEYTLYVKHVENAQISLIDFMLLIR
jgi:hypothetical protein